jgi:D-alanyl-lipoteichoic acid acyltransferase DltB (MBOAT superfamily)
MLFNSLEFLIFFPVVTALFFALPHRARWLMLLLASCYFYMAFIPAYLLILVFTIVIDYFAGILIERSQGVKRKWALVASLVANVGVLAVFKYYGWLNHTFGEPLPVLGIILPIGLSFHTFQAMSYTIEVYRGHQRAERHFGIYALYVMFYPQLVAGPIERPQNLLPQFRERKRWDWARVFDGLKLMTWGLFMKVVIADRLAIYVNEVYGQPEAFHGWPLLIATYFFAFQIYCDFAGYSLIAIGAARVMGYDLMENFRRPYFSKSIGEFWRRWHISLSTWFRDYLYIPLGGSRVPVPRWYLNLFLVFLISGLWHGANWTFVVWGGLHGLYLVLGVMTGARREAAWARVSDAYDLWQSSAEGVRVRGLALRRGPRVATLKRWVQVLVTFHLVLLAWVFFRAESLADAFAVLGRAFDFRGGRGGAFLVGLSGYEFGLALASIAFLTLVHVAERGRTVQQIVSARPAWVRYSVYAAVVLAILFFGKFGAREFIYFQF